jgi:hypothetical protein
MRRILKRLFTGENLGDLSTLANPESVEEIKSEIKSQNYNLKLKAIFKTK